MTQTPISTRDDISIWWNPGTRTFDITVSELCGDPYGNLDWCEVLYWQTRGYSEARTYRWMLMNKRNSREV
jgi:hypothetical protein